jgi:hypothetical protein
MNQTQQKITRYGYRKISSLIFHHVFWDLDISVKNLQRRFLSPPAFITGKKY